MTNVISIEDHKAKAWEEYVSAQLAAQKSMAIEDGIEAGRAWRRWLNLFMSPEQRQYLDGKREAAAI